MFFFFFFWTAGVGMTIHSLWTTFGVFSLYISAACGRGYGDCFFFFFFFFSFLFFSRLVSLCFCFLGTLVTFVNQLISLFFFSLPCSFGIIYLYYILPFGCIAIECVVSRCYVRPMSATTETGFHCNGRPYEKMAFFLLLFIYDLNPSGIECTQPDASRRAPLHNRPLPVPATAGTRCRSRRSAYVGF